MFSSPSRSISTSIRSRSETPLFGTSTVRLPSSPCLPSLADLVPPLSEKFITPEAFAKIFCDDLDIPASYVAEITRQITEQCEEQTGVAEVAVRGEEEEQQDIEKDLRVVLNVRFLRPLLHHLG